MKGRPWSAFRGETEQRSRRWSGGGSRRIDSQVRENGTENRPDQPAAVALFGLLRHYTLSDEDLHARSLDHIHLEFGGGLLPDAAGVRGGGAPG